MPEFDFFVGGIEDGMIELLWQELGAAADPPGYLNQIAAYSGELDEGTLKRFVNELTPRFPLMLVTYGDGDDKLMPATSPAYGEPRIFQHGCTFSVFCCSDDARGEADQRHGVYEMLADARKHLAGRQLRKLNGADQVLLTLEPLRISGVEYLARLPGLTAYVQHFDTYFKWTEPDRRVAGQPVDSLIFDVTPLNAPGAPGELPGVVSE